MNILTESEIFKPEGIVKIEKMKSAKYVCETCLKGKGGGWLNQPVAIFWNINPANIPAGGSAWFGLLFQSDPFYTDLDPRLMIVNAISAVETPIQGVVADNGDVIYSRFRHDYRVSPDKSVFIDGGRDYTRTGSAAIGTVDNFVTLQIKEGELCII